MFQWYLNQKRDYLKIIFESKIDCIQLRFKYLKTIDLYNLGKDLKKDCVKFKKTLIVNDRVDIAISINAHGAHVGMDDLPYDQARKMLGKKSGLTYDKVRELKQFLSQTSSVSEYKIIIIDPIENLTINATNTLLKSLEETNHNTYIFLISHNLENVLKTIQSRVFKFYFNPISKEEFISLLRL